MSTRSRQAPLAIGPLALLLAAAAVAQQQTVGVFVDDPRAFPGYTLFAPQRSTTTWLIDNHGREVHTWASVGFPGNAVYLTATGGLLRLEQVMNGTFNAGGAGGKIRVLDWDGNLEWEFVYSSSLHLQHHDAKMLPNGNVLMIAWELKSQAEAVAAGRDPTLLRDGALWPDSVLELQPDGQGGATVVWEWHLWDHLVQDRFPAAANYGTVADRPELVDLNFTSGGPAGGGADWTHVNAVAHDPDLDQVLLSVHNLNEIWVIDHTTTTAEAAGHAGGRQGRGGDLLYRWGNPQAYRLGAAADRRLFGQHDAQWIAPGLPGAGHILVFNNGPGRPGGNASSIDEIAPPVDASGSYARTSGQAFGPAALAWTYADPVPGNFFATNISGAQRMANGDTLVCNGPAGTFFEVTSAGETVWRYVNPVGSAGAVTQADPIPGGAGGLTNSVFKIRRYAPGDPGLLGRDLSPGGPVEAYVLLRNAEVTSLAPLAPALASIFTFTQSGLSTLDPVGDFHRKPFHPGEVDPDPNLCPLGPLLFYQINSDRYVLTVTRDGGCGLRFYF